jgi:two-component system sensor histidine kinase BaeS
VRRRLTGAILVLVAGTLLLAALGSVLLVRRASATTAEQQLYTQAHALADYPSPEVFLHSIHVVRYVGQYRALTIVGLSAEGTFTSALPPGLRGLALDTPALERNLAVGGTTGNLVYVLIPLHLTTAQKAHLTHPLPYEDTAVLVASRSRTPPVGGYGYFLLIALGCLAIATVVAYWLARRFTRPLLVVASATERIATGDLSVQLPVGPRDMPEFASLATAINDMSVRLQRARDQQRLFLLSVSHDLRTPLTSIRGYAEALADGTATDRQGALAIIDAEARRLERLVGDLLDLARLEATRFSLDAGRVDVVGAVDAMVRQLSPAANALGIELVLPTGSAQSLEVVTDADRLDQILANLVDNALSFAANRVELRVWAEQGLAFVSVEDDGPGIPKGDLARVFEAHFVSDQARRRRRGSGLGLAIVAELTTAMGGGVRAESPCGPAGGTRMIFWLPVTGPSARRSAER